ncbi:MAG: TIGR02221 family CRISPR-associated protein [Desulfonauticus sp.]|nr:TIGR02221 family CRISPR-associated protein [Desulfonauticus sp.]
MAKILISSLGTGKRQNNQYDRAIYEYNGKQKETPFIAKALSDFLEIDKLFLVGTKKSIWDCVCYEFGGNEDYTLKLYDKQHNGTLSQNDLTTLNTIIDNYLGTKGSECFIIEYGLNEKELWNNFHIYLKILEKITDKDKVYLDITHSFRSLSLMSFVMLNFGEIIKKKTFTIDGIFYGMLEYRHENNGITPIVDLKMFYALMKWIIAIENFTEYSNGDKIVSLLQENENKEEKKIFERISLSFQMSNLFYLHQNVKQLSNKLNKLKNSKNQIVNLLIEEVENFINFLNRDRISDFQLAVAKWFYEHKNYALSYMALTEAIVSKVCEAKGYNVEDKDARNQAKKEISQINKNLYHVFKNVREIRNNIAHQLQDRKDAVSQDRVNLENYLKKTEDLFFTIDYSSIAHKKFE